MAGRRGEVQHAPLDGGSHVPWQLFLSVLKEQRFLDKVSIICESKSEAQNNLDFRVDQALQLKTFIESKRIEKEYRSTRPALTQFFSLEPTKNSD